MAVSNWPHKTSPMTITATIQSLCLCLSSRQAWVIHSSRARVARDSSQFRNSAFQSSYWIRWIQVRIFWPLETLDRVLETTATAKSTYQRCPQMPWQCSKPHKVLHSSIGDRRSTVMMSSSHTWLSARGRCSWNWSKETMSRQTLCMKNVSKFNWPSLR